MNNRGNDSLESIIQTARALAGERAARRRKAEAERAAREEKEQLQAAGTAFSDRSDVTPAEEIPVSDPVSVPEADSPQPDIPVKAVSPQPDASPETGSLQPDISAEKENKTASPEAPDLLSESPEPEVNPAPAEPPLTDFIRKEQDNFAACLEEMKQVCPQTPEEKSDRPAEEKAVSPDSLHSVGVHFLEFSVAFLSLAKCRFQQIKNVKVNSLPFFTLIALDSWAEEDFTMSRLAEKLQITKQQLSRLINDLEERGMVERIHDTANRRRVYIRITEGGHQMMNEVKQEMLTYTLHGLRPYTEEELAEMDTCLCTLSRLMERFNTESESPQDPSV